MKRRTFLHGLSSFSLIPLWISRNSFAQNTPLKRVLFFYFPDGVPGKTDEGEPSKWHCTGSESSPILSPLLKELEDFQDHLVFLNGLSLDPYDQVQRQHVPGAKRLMTGGKHVSIDHVLGSHRNSRSWNSIYLGVQSTQNPPAEAQYLSHPIPGVAIPPLEDPLEAFCEIFHSAALPNASCNPNAQENLARIDHAIADLERFRSTLGGLESQKLSYHLESLHSIQQRFASPVFTEGIPILSESLLLETPNTPAAFPHTLKAQSDILISAMELGITDVGFIQCSRHTSSLYMSDFSPDIPDMSWMVTSHDASHYTKPSDMSNLKFAIYYQQRRWYLQQFRYLLQELSLRPDGDGSMLDSTLVVAMSEISDGNTHSLDNMPFLLAGGGLQGNRLLEYDKVTHCSLWLSIAQAMGVSIDSFGDFGTEPLRELFE